MHLATGQVISERETRKGDLLLGCLGGIERGSHATAPRAHVLIGRQRTSLIPYKAPSIPQDRQVPQDLGISVLVAKST
jgi:hypothetical protein